MNISHNSSIAESTKFNNNQLLLLKMMEEINGYAIFLLDKDGNVETWNKGAEKIKGYKAEEIIGKNFSLFYTEGDRKKGVPATILAEADQLGTTYHESWRIRKDGTAFWGSITLTALHDESKKVVGYAKVTRDLTEKMQAETTIKKHLIEVERKNKELEQFAYIASHDLQEPPVNHYQFY
ncbi:PAS domain-containing protein [Mucilaginibacter flavidus]|uniref:PAS domain-containing protein n=1 Tax=Mucilaginibacter flavidus TaxID=2949309 RepID=UPI0020924809|nr:PAS domain S-box protein [Mucilaginibacter flavidus]MCO5948480.1 PAS domain S-box protein [Mucilaginibacter flavidus]